MVKKSSRLTRRRILSSLGAGTAITSFSRIGSAHISELEKFKRTIETATNIRQNADFEAYENYLEAKGIETVTTGGRYPLKGENSSEENGGFSTEKIDNVDTAGIDIVMSLSGPTRYVPAYYAKLYWRYYFKRGTYPESTGEKPFDAIGFGWKDSCWELAWNDLDNTSYSSEYVNYEDGASGIGTFGFNVDDYEIASNTNSDSCSGYDCETYSDYYWGGSLSKCSQSPRLLR